MKRCTKLLSGVCKWAEFLLKPTIEGQHLQLRANMLKYFTDMLLWRKGNSETKDCQEGGQWAQSKIISGEGKDFDAVN